MASEHPDSDYVKGVDYYLSGEWVEAEKIFERLNSGSSSTSIKLMLGDIYYSLGKLDDAFDVYKQSLALNPEYCIVYYKMGVCTYRAGKLEEALKYFQKAKEFACSSDAMVCYYIGLINYFLGNDKESISNFETLRKESNESKIANYYLAKLKIKRNEFEEAISLLEELLSITPSFPEIYHLLGEAYYKTHELFKAINCLRKALELNPHDNKAKEMLEYLTMQP
jgi:tetratricopeptide (TPR) repeat protein